MGIERVGVKVADGVRCQAEIRYRAAGEALLNPLPALGDIGEIKVVALLPDFSKNLTGAEVDNIALGDIMIDCETDLPLEGGAVKMSAALVENLNLSGAF